MRMYNYHTHTTFSDGANSPEEMVCAAIKLGFDSIGISDHSVTEFDLSWCLAPEQTKVYVETIHELKRKYAGQIRVYCGLEQDAFSPPPPKGVEYLIGSVHWLKAGETYVSVDESREVLQTVIREMFAGDCDALAEKYYGCVGAFAEDPGVSVIGHFDLITKFDETAPLFLPTERYTAAWQNAAKRLIEAGKIFEINTGAMARGCRSVPYPAGEILEYLGEHGAKVLLSSDCHNTASLNFGFEKAQVLAKQYGCCLVDLF